MNERQSLFQQAQSLHQAGQWEEAEPLYRALLAQWPEDGDSLNLLGVLIAQKGDLPAAIALLRQAVAAAPDHAGAWGNLGLALLDLAPAEAEAALRQSLALQPLSAETGLILGGLLTAQGRWDEAAAFLKGALDLMPDQPQGWSNLGLALHGLGRFDEALAAHRQAVAGLPGHPQALYNMAVTLAEMGRPYEAEAAYRQALDLAPDDLDIRNNLGGMLHRTERLDEAISCYAQVLEKAPDHASALYNLGRCHHERDALDQAVDLYRRSLTVRPGNAETHANLSMVLLAQGNFPDGWAEYEWRWQTPSGAKQKRDFLQPLWRGQAAARQSILIHAEQGFGDTLQFCRLTRQVAELGLTVILAVQPALKRLLQGLEGCAQVLSLDEPLPSCDWHCPLLSLPLALGLTLERLPPFSPYLRAEPAGRLGPLKPLRVGLVWSGGERLDDPLAKAANRRRSMPPAYLEPLFAVRGCRFVSLQKDGPRAPAQFSLVDPMAEMRDFADTAALIQELDLVIAVDTAVAHLAAGLGKPVWLLDRHDACWRWLRGRDDSPWYPSIRIFRQRKAGDWAEVMERVTAALRDKALRDKVGQGGLLRRLFR